MPAIKRMTIAFAEEDHQRILELGELTKISYARLVGCLMCLPDEEIKRIIDENYANRYQNKAAKKAKERELLKLVKGMTPEQLAAMISNSQKGE
jgi:hypothetical protein